MALAAGLITNPTMGAAICATFSPTPATFRMSSPTVLKIDKNDISAFLPFLFPLEKLGGLQIRRSVCRSGIRDDLVDRHQLGVGDLAIPPLLGSDGKYRDG